VLHDPSLAALISRLPRDPKKDFIVIAELLIVELDALAARDINHTSTVGAPLLLVLLFGEALALCNDQVCVGPVSIVIRNVIVAGEARVHFDGFGDALEALKLLLLGLGRVTILALALIVGSKGGSRGLCGERLA